MTTPTPWDLGVESLYAVGGMARVSAAESDEWHMYGEARVVELNLRTGEREIRLSHTSPPEACADGDDPSFIFKSASMVDDVLYLCSQTEVMTYRVPDFTRLDYCSLPMMNDVHHVAPDGNGGYLVANTGLDAFLHIDAQHQVIDDVSVAPPGEAKTFDPATDYRKVVTTRPHVSHPNFVFQADGKRWITRFAQKDAVCIDDPSRTLSVEVERIHDGIPRGDRVWFTSVDGHVVGVDLATGTDRVVVELRSPRNPVQVLGWCRGLHFLDDRYALVGLTRTRHTKNSENVKWMKARMNDLRNYRHLPNRVVLVDLQSGDIIWECVLEPELDAVFSFHPS
jgi:hypothetical protein